MHSLAQRLIAVPSATIPAWLRHAAWFAAWWVAGFSATLLIVGW